MRFPSTAQATAPILFDFGALPVRVQRDSEGNPWFAAADVCAAVGIKNSRDSIASLDDDERGVANTDTPGGRQSVATVNESGLYALIFRSRKPEARRFKKWITATVLPTLRQDGAYIVGEETLSAGLSEEELRAQIAELEARLESARAAKVTRMSKHYQEKLDRREALRSIR